jgi:hypothetical protein
MLDGLKGVKIDQGGIICFANDLLQLDEKNFIIPLQMI